MQCGTSTDMDHMTGDAKAEAVAQPPFDLEKLYRKHYHHLMRFVQRYVRNQDDAADIVQTTFLEAIRCADRFSGLSKPSTWLFGIALNLARNHLRRTAASLFDAIDEAALEQIADISGDPSMALELRQIAEKVGAVLNELPQNMRTTFEAVLEGDATYEQAAAQLNIPVGTVRSRVSRVRAAVRSQCA